MNPSPREIKRRRRTALMLYMDHRPIAYIAQRLGMTESVVVELLAQAGAKNIQYEGAGTPDPLLEAPAMPKKLKTYEELLIENMQLRNENLRLRHRLVEDKHQRITEDVTRVKKDISQVLARS